MTEKNQEIKYPQAIVGSLIINNNNKLLFCKSPKWKGKYTIFGGKVEYGETIEDAVIRETKEETRLDVKPIAKLGILNSIFDSGFHEKRHFIFIDFLCKYAGGDDEVEITDEHEGKCEWVTIDEARKLDLANGAKLILEEFIKYKKEQEYLDGWKRCQADFENYRKMQSQMQKDSLRYAISDIALQIFPVLDNFNASVEHIPEDQKNNPWVAGIMHIQRQLEQVLKDNGIKPIDVKVGDEFNPEIHEAIGNHSEEKETEHKISQVVQKGYKMEKRILRPAKVIVK